MSFPTCPFLRTLVQDESPCRDVGHIPTISVGDFNLALSASYISARFTTNLRDSVDQLRGVRDTSSTGPKYTSIGQYHWFVFVE